MERECPDFNSVEPEIFLSSMKVSLGTPGRAFLTVPPGVVEIKKSLLPGAGSGAISKSFIRRHTWLGEYEGEYAPNEDHPFLPYAWTINFDNKTAYYVDAYNVRSSNWLRYVNCARHVSEQNVDKSQCYSKMYYRTTKDVAPGQELLAYYGNGYAKYALRIDVASYYNRTANITLVYEPSP